MHRIPRAKHWQLSGEEGNAFANYRRKKDELFSFRRKAIAK